MELESWKEKLAQALARIRAFAYQRVRVRPPRAEPPRAERRVGVALGGGFARGLAHIGVLKVLEDSRIPVGCLAGTSIGSIIGGAYASGVSVAEMATVARGIRWKDFGSWTISTRGLASNQRLEALVRRTFRALRFEDLKIPLAIIATDLVNAQPVVFTAGELGVAVRASCAYPGLFLPVAVDGSLLVDGMLVSAVPAEAVRELGADIVISVNLDNIRYGLEPKNIAEVWARALSIATRAAEPVWREQSDIVIEPEVRHFDWDDFGRADELIAAGEEAMLAALPRLKRLLEEPGEARAAS
ncbi:MAG TPA: patatin-like phospholipase family protein [Candidatus Xenobia bacterium]|nr:patatin-like phospholipase family protein [Candidatus Xenobia bacterium]